ncbi:hypothetical protein [Oceanobacillus timonensis]|uniref:hypothetical protein n=1 Tax=Oceanobacillus timonensis TaxID=1926285 RepID=UPI0009BA5DDF|nr:hypothetical protein [Oceanobacillus timonensis]
MSVDMYIAAAQEQGESVTTICQQEQERYQALINALEAFISDNQLQSNTYFNAKLFYEQVLIPLAKAGILLSETVEEACQKFPNQYLATVDSGDLSSSELEAQIQRMKDHILYVQEIQEMVETSDISGVFKSASIWANEQIMDNLMDSKRYLEGKLNMLLDFHQRSPQFFSKIKELEDIVNKGAEQAQNAWAGPSTGFKIPSADNLTWTNDIGSKWAEREERVKQEKLEAEDEYHIQMIEEVTEYDLLLWKNDIGFGEPKFNWILEKNGERVSDDELEAYLNEHSDLIDENLYKEIDEHYIEEKELEAQRQGKTYLTGHKYEDFQKVSIQTGAYLTMFQRSGISSLASLKNPGISRKSAINKNKSKEASVVTKNNGIGSDGKFADPIVEGKYQTYYNLKTRRGETPRSRLKWKEVSEYWRIHSPMARGRKFNETAREAEIYPHHEVHLSNGKRIDSYDPDAGEIISRKSTYLDNISDRDFRTHLAEFENKYKKGTLIRSNQYKEINGQKLHGEYILELPASNLKSEKLTYFKDMAAEYNVTLRFLKE